MGDKGAKAQEKGDEGALTGGIPLERTGQESGGPLGIKGRIPLGPP